MPLSVKSFLPEFFLMCGHQWSYHESRDLGLSALLWESLDEHRTLLWHSYQHSLGSAWDVLACVIWEQMMPHVSEPIPSIFDVLFL